jgi:hypothetical protein
MNGGELTVDRAAGATLTGSAHRSGPGPDLDLDDSASVAERVFLWLLIIVWLGVAAATLGYGLPYYRLPLALRADSPFDELLRPSGLIGQGYGVVGTFLITVGVGMYSLRKRVPFLRRLGPLHLWLEAHIFLCTLGPFLVLLHTTFKFGGIVSIAFWSMTAVALSGLFGRYVYGHIPRAIHGQRSTLESLRTTKGELVARITESHPTDAAALRPYLITPPPTQPAGLVHALFLALKYDLTRRSRVHRLRRAVQHSRLPVVLQHDLVAVVRAQTTLEQQNVLLQPFQRLFHYWHVFHLPLTVVMFVILAVHVGVAVAFGYTWIF